MAVERPVFLNLWQLRFPLAAVVSILHRVSGVVLGLSLPCLLWLWSVSLRSEAGFVQVAQAVRGHGWSWLLWFVVLAALWFHVLAGVRHLIMDLGWGETRAGSRMSAIALLLCFVLGCGLLGMRLW